MWVLIPVDWVVSLAVFLQVCFLNVLLLGFEVLGFWGGFDGGLSSLVRDWKLAFLKGLVVNVGCWGLCRIYSKLRRVGLFIEISVTCFWFLGFVGS